LQTLAEAAERTAWEIHAYVLMRNHYHFLLVTPNGNLVDGMKWFQGTFTQRINARHHWRGHLFQGRYKAQNIDRVESEGYFLTVANYIHLNPARAQMIGKNRRWKKLQDYPWSSLACYHSAKRQRPKWLHVDEVFEQMQWNDTPHGRRAYGNYLEKRLVSEKNTQHGKKTGEETSHPTLTPWFLGSETFREHLMEKIEDVVNGKKKGSIRGAGVRETNERQAEKLIAKGLIALKIQRDHLKQTNKSDPKKQALAWLIRSKTTASTSWISEQLSMGDPSNVSRAVSVIRQSRQGELAQWKRKLTEMK
ncbi:MAG: hypothetical protein GXP30_12490, partial [Verrucomicrobia bacterium]|nr:hypothetical protein [Verrucomicrobiota bacterium]